MKKIILAGLLACLLLLSACTPAPEGGAPALRVVATTYPVYLFTCAVTQEVEGVEVVLMVNQPTACLHDYTLTVNDMKAVEGADVIVKNGAGLEDFMADALATADAAVIDCSEGVALLPYEGHEGHDHGEGEGGHFDPHFWMDAARAGQLVDNIARGLIALDGANEADYRENAMAAAALLHSWDGNLRDILCEDTHTAPVNRNLITFHDGFRYFAEAYGFTLLKAVEEEEGSEASAREIREIVALIGQHDIPVIFTEAKGSEATAKAVARECGVSVAQLTMLMSGEDFALSAYLDGQMDNAIAIVNGFAGQEVLR